MVPIEPDRQQEAELVAHELHAMRWANSRVEEFHDGLGSRYVCHKSAHHRCRKAAELVARGIRLEVVRAMRKRCERYAREPSKMFAWMLQRLPKVLRESWCPPCELRPLPRGAKETHWGRTRNVASALSTILANLEVIDAH